MKQYKNAKLLSEDCMVKRFFEGIRGGINNQYLTRYIDTIKFIEESLEMEIK